MLCDCADTESCFKLSEQVINGEVASNCSAGIAALNLINSSFFLDERKSRPKPDDYSRHARLQHKE